MLQDFRYAIRSLTRRPLVTGVAVLSLALGIGVNSAIFSLFDRLILRRLPVPSPDEIVLVTSPGPRPGSRSTDDFSGGVDAIFSYPLFRDLERLEDDGLQLAAHASFGANVAYEGRSSEASGLLVSGQYFPALGVTPALGRLLGPQDDRVPGGHPVVVLSYDFWRTRFGADAGIVNRTLIVNGGAMTIVGVAPSGFTGITALQRTQIFVPLAMAEQAFRDPAWNGLAARNNHWLYLFARTEPGVSRQRAEELVNISFAGLIRDVEYPALRTGMGDTDRQEFQKRQIYLQDGARGANSNRRDDTDCLRPAVCRHGVRARDCLRERREHSAGAGHDSRGRDVGSAVARCQHVPSRSVAAERGGAARHTWRSRRSRRRPPDDQRHARHPPCGWSCSPACTRHTPARVHAHAWTADERRVRTLPCNACRARGARGRCEHAYRSSLGLQNGGALSHVDGRHAAGARDGVARRCRLARGQSGEHRCAWIWVSRREGLIAFGLSPSLNGYTPDNAAQFFDRLDAELRAMPGVTSVTATTDSDPLRRAAGAIT